MKTMSKNVEAEKCAGCHLFIEENTDWLPGSELAQYLHVDRGGSADENITSTHDAAPSGERHDLDYWKKNGPWKMRQRFMDDTLAGVNVRVHTTDSALSFIDGAYGRIVSRLSPGEYDLEEVGDMFVVQVNGFGVFPLFADELYEVS